MKTTLNDKWANLKMTILLSAAGLLLLGVILAGCSGGKADKVVIRGSNTVGEELAPRLITEFRKTHPNVAFDLEFKGSTYGFGALMVGRCDIAAASRVVSTNELDMAQSRNVAFNEYIIGEYSVAVVINAGNPVANLTADQVRDIFTGAIQNWQEVGGPDAAIHLHIRDPISGTYLGFQELAMEKKPYALGVKTHTNYVEIANAVGRDAQGIGYSSIDLAKSANVRAVSIGGVAPDANAVNQGQYPYARVLRLYTDKARESQAAMEFIQLVQSARGQKILAEMGFVPRS
ncbi:MAG: phosphate ABC transporter substrate-binding protein [Verrucomicrobia bacterium]|jgi:phosphate transport system substrate-binding protein|nr:phosphate ABC transporter substrate-binding protein [Verrucomicrobiota bacterium]